MQDGVALESDLYTGVALGVELSPSTQFQVEYGVTDTEAKPSKKKVEEYDKSGGDKNRAVFDAKEETISGNFLIGTGRLAPPVPRAPVREPVVTPPPVTQVPVPVPVPVAVVETPEFVDSDGDGVADHLDLCPNTPRNVVVDANGCPVERAVQEDLRMELRVFFDRDKSNIKPQFREEVAKVAEKMREFPNATAAIEGHASKDSNRSSARYNQRLSEARANAVRSMLSSEFGIAPNRISAVGYGFDRPVVPNDTAENKALNRRVYAVIQGNKVTNVVETKN